MPLLIGTDEAGYGPNLGPLVIAATTWRVPHEHLEDDLYDLLSDAVSCNPSDGRQRIAIADSKQLYKPGGPLAGLETGVHAALASLDRTPATWRQTFQELTHNSAASDFAAPWYEEYDEPVPLDISRETIARHAMALLAACREKQIELLDVRASVILPSAFNKTVRQLGSKGALLTEATLRLVDDLLKSFPADDALVHCDKHGGRNRYAAALQHVWPESWIQIGGESRGQSAYSFAIGQRGIRFCFAVGGESQLPAALASMTAKYLRELAMRALNAFWQQHLDNLRPTAGYPVDARRFKAEIAQAQRRLRIEEDDVWRCK